MGSIFGQVDALGYSFLKPEEPETNNKQEVSEDVDMDGEEDKRKEKQEKEEKEPKGKGKAEEGDGKRKEDNPLKVADSYLLGEVQKLDLEGVDEIYGVLRHHPQLESALMNAFATIAQAIRYKSRSFSTGVELRCLVSFFFFFFFTLIFVLLFGLVFFFLLIILSPK